MLARKATCLLVICLVPIACSANRNFSFVRWSKQYETGVKDVGLSIALDDGNGFVYIVGRTEGPRGGNTSFPGLVYNNAMKPSGYDDSKTYRDAIIAKVSKLDGKVLWAERLELTQQSRFSAVSLSKDHLTVYAAGTVVSSSENHPFMIQAFNADTGKRVGKLFKARGKGRHIISTLIGHKRGVYVCGRASKAIGTSLDATSSAVGGIIVGSVSKSGSLKWLRQTGRSLTSDICSGLSLSEDQKSLFVAGTVHQQELSHVGLAGTAVYATDARKGKLLWKKTIEISPGSATRSESIVTRRDAVYVLTSFWTEIDNLRRTYLHKLSKSRGTLLWSKETCCTSVLKRDSVTTPFEDRGSATPVSGIGLFSDRYIYHLAYYRRAKELSSAKYAAVVVRMDEYGGQVDENDISYPVQSFRIIPAEPKAAVFSYLRPGIFMLSNDVPESSEDVDSSITSLKYLRFNRSSTAVTSKPSHGSFYFNMALKLHVSDVSVGAVSDILAERLRLAHSQIRFTSNQTVSSVSRKSEADFRMKLYGENPRVGKLFEDYQKELLSLFVRKGESERNDFERHFGIPSNSVNLVRDSIHLVEEGLSATSAEDGTSSSNAQNFPLPVEMGQRLDKFKWNVFGIAAGCLAGVVLLVGAILFVIKQRSQTEESFVASSFHGRPTGVATGDITHTNY